MYGWRGRSSLSPCSGRSGSTTRKRSDEVLDDRRRTRGATAPRVQDRAGRPGPRLAVGDPRAVAARGRGGASSAAPRRPAAPPRSAAAPRGVAARGSSAASAPGAARARPGCALAEPRRGAPRRPGSRARAPRASSVRARSSSVLGGAPSARCRRSAARRRVTRASMQRAQRACRPRARPRPARRPAPGRPRGARRCRRRHRTPRVVRRAARRASAASEQRRASERRGHARRRFWRCFARRTTARSSRSPCRRSARWPPSRCTGARRHRDRRPSRHDRAGGAGARLAVITTLFALCIFLTYGTTAQVARLHGAGERGAGGRARRAGAVARARDRHDAGDRRRAARDPLIALLGGEGETARARRALPAHRRRSACPAFFAVSPARATCAASPICARR